MYYDLYFIELMITNFKVFQFKVSENTFLYEIFIIYKCKYGAFNCRVNLIFDTLAFILF